MSAAVCVMSCLQQYASPIKCCYTCTQQGHTRWGHMPVINTISNHGTMGEHGPPSATVRSELLASSVNR